MFYAVRAPHRRAVLDNWAQGERFVRGVPHVEYKSFYTRAEAEAFSCGTESVLLVYTSGAGTAGVGVWFGPDNLSWSVAERLPKRHRQTNQCAEIYAIVRAMEVLDERRVPKTRHVLVITNSMYCLRAHHEWIPYRWSLPHIGWTNTKGEPVKNRALLERMHAALLARGDKLRLTHAKGAPNEDANRLACLGNFCTN